jgi:hypothetical protein
MAAKKQVKRWYASWTEGEDSIAPYLNTLEGLGHTIFQVIYVRYSDAGRVGYRVIYWKMEDENNHVK